MEHHHDPAQAPEFEIVGKPTMLAKFEGRLDAERILDSLRRIGYPLEDVSVLFRIEGSDEVLDLTTGQPAAGQSITAGELKPKQLTKGQTAVLLHPDPAQVEAIQKALAEVGNANIEYVGETHAFGRPGGIERVDEPAQPDEQTEQHGEQAT